MLLSKVCRLKYCCHEFVTILISEEVTLFLYTLLILKSSPCFFKIQVQKLVQPWPDQPDRFCQACNYSNFDLYELFFNLDIKSDECDPDLCIKDLILLRFLPKQQLTSKSHCQPQKSCYSEQII